MSMTVLARSLRDRWLSTTVTTAVLALWLLLAMAVYADIDLSIYTDLPEAMRAVMGIPGEADAATLAHTVVFGTIGGLTLGGLALSMGASAVAGEERDGTLGLLLANPVSRTQVLVARATSLTLLVAAGATGLWAVGHLVPALLGVEIGETHLAAMAAHLAGVALVHGLLALAVGAWTGRRTLASGTAVAVMSVSFIAVGVLPLVDAVADLARIFPWYYFDSSRPLVNGVAWGHLAVLYGGSLALLAAAVAGVNRRDLVDRSDGPSLLDRLRTHPMTQRLAEQVAGSARVSHIWARTVSQHQAIVVITAVTMFSMMGVLMGPMFTFISDEMAGAAASFPEEVLAFAGGGDLATAEGFLQVETFGLMAPIATILVAVAVAARALAGEEAANTMGLLLANPVRRSRIVVEKAVAMVLLTAVVGVATWAGVSLGIVIAGLDVSIAGVAATSALVTLLGLVFGALALAISAATGRAGLTISVTVGVALTAHVAEAYLPLSERVAGWARLSPFHYYLTSDPLRTGMPWGHAALLAGLAVALMAAAVVLFQRHDLRQH